MNESGSTAVGRPRVIRWFASIPARALLGLIWIYRHTLSPALPAVFGPPCGCRFYPTCAQYAADAVRVHGAVRGAWLAVRRLFKCHPFHPGGFDPVPPAVARSRATSRTRPTVRRVSPPPQRRAGCTDAKVPAGRR